MVAKDIRWIRLLDPENHNISWANHISHTNPGKRDKSDPSFKRQWSRLFHCAALGFLDQRFVLGAPMNQPRAKSRLRFRDPPLLLSTGLFINKLGRHHVTGAKLRARKFIWGIHKAV